MSARVLAGFGASVGSCSIALTSAAFAAPVEQTVSFAIPSQPLDQALLQFGVQGRVSINAGAAAQCRAWSNTLEGSFTRAQALTVMLDKTGCTFRTIDGSTVLIVRGAPRLPQEAEEVVVITAARRETNLDRAPYAVSAISGAALNEFGSSGPADADSISAQIAGVTLTNLGMGRNKIFLRGLSDGALTGRTQSTVGYYQDNVRITYDAPDPDLPLIDIDRVEVLRGPQGTLYGAGSIGGVFHVVTKRPDLEAYTGMLSSSVAATQTGDPSTTTQGFINIPIVHGKFGLRAAGWLDVSGGVIDDIALARQDVDGVHRFGGRLTSALQITPHWRSTTGITLQTIDAGDTHYAQEGLGAYERALNVREPHDNDFLDAATTLDGETGLGRLTLTSALVRHEITSRYDATDARATFAPAASGVGQFDDADNIKMVVNEARIVSREMGRLNWMAGLFVSVGEKDTFGRFSLPEALPSAVDAYSEYRTDQINEAALYGQITYNLTNSLSLTGGLRWFGSELKTDSRIARPLEASSAAFSAQTTDSGLAPQIALTYSPHGRATYYLSASEGYRAGGFNTADGDRGVYSTAPGAPQPARMFRPDEMWSYEAGARFALAHDRVRLRAAAYFAHWRDAQAERLLASGLSYTSNAGDAQNLGFEVEAHYVDPNGFSTEAHASWSEPELNHPDPSFPGTADSGLPGVPNVTYGVGAQYRHALTEKLTGAMRAQLDYVGASHLTFDAATAPSMGGYSNVSLSAAVSSDRWQLSAFLENTANEDGNTFAYGNPFSLHTSAQSTPQRPRTLGIAVRRKF